MMRGQVFFGAMAGAALLGLLVYCSPASTTTTDTSDAATTVRVCDDAGANCPCDITKFKQPAPCYTGAKGTAGKGGCKAGTRSCGADGLTTECVGEVVPSTELCDYLDNDCNGAVDDVPGTSALDPSEGGAPLIDTCQSPSCDPSFSDAGVACYTGTTRNVCKAGTKVCGAGRQLACEAFTGIAPQAEQCNGWDDDCNDQVDDGLDNMGMCDVDPDAGYTGADGGAVLGECLHSTQHCWDGGAACPPSDPNAEKCDGKDNDCNGKIDDKSCTQIPSNNYCCSSGNYHTCAPSYYTNYGYKCTLAN